jgi:hypothetical protein
MNMALLIPEGDNLVTYYVLPLIGVNKATFGSCYGCSYLNSSGSTLYVRLLKNMQAPTYKTNKNYVSEFVYESHLFIIFSIPHNYLPDVILFLKGSYSFMSKEAKRIIYESSTLPFNKTIGSFSMSHPILQALDKTKTLRQFLTTYLGIVPLPDSVELIDPPGKSWFIEFYIT